MNKVLAPLAAALLCSCSALRWSGHPDPELNPNYVWSASELTVSTGPAKARPQDLPEPQGLPDTLYYADLGPDTIDVSDYPSQQKYNYALFAAECARCHTLARAVNSPVQSRLYWHYHLSRMSLHSRFRRRGPIGGAERAAILDFLEYDAQVRKVQDRKRFEERTEELKRRFEPVLKRLLERMRKTDEPGT